jgi:hypothetical protein
MGVVASWGGKLSFDVNIENQPGQKQIAFISLRQDKFLQSFCARGTVLARWSGRSLQWKAFLYSSITRRR